MRYQVLRIMSDKNHADKKLVYTQTRDGENEVLVLSDAWLKKNNVKVGTLLVTDEKQCIKKQEKEQAAKEKQPAGDEFKQLVIDACLDSYESKCRLAQELLKMEGYPNVQRASFKLIEELYKEIKTESENNVYVEKFCDIAVRYGDYYYNGIGVRKNKMSAYKYYLEAKTIYDYRRNFRSKYSKKLGEEISERIKRYEAEKNSTEYDRIVTPSFVHDYPMFLLDVLGYGSAKYRIRGIIKRIDARDYYMKLIRIGESGTYNNSVAPRFLLSIPEQELCIYGRELNLYLEGTDFKTEFVEEFIADSFDYDKDNDELTFILNDEEVMSAKIDNLAIDSG